MLDSPTQSETVVSSRNLAPPRPGVRHVRVPVVGIIVADDVLRDQIRRRFHWPMIVLALLVLPLLAVDFFFLSRHPERVGTWLWWICMSGLGVIWFAFLIEFVIKITIAECRIEYVRRNWLDIIIIAVPVLRPLRVAAVARTTRVFTLRGVGMKFARYLFTIVIGLEASERMLRRIGIKAKTGRREPEKMTRYELMDELRKLRKLTDAWESWHDAREAYVKANQRDPLEPEGPTGAAGDSKSE